MKNLRSLTWQKIEKLCLLLNITGISYNLEGFCRFSFKHLPIKGKYLWLAHFFKIFGCLASRAALWTFWLCWNCNTFWTVQRSGIDNFFLFTQRWCKGGRYLASINMLIKEKPLLTKDDSKVTRSIPRSPIRQSLNEENHPENWVSTVTYDFNGNYTNNFLTTKRKISRFMFLGVWER